MKKLAYSVQFPPQSTNDNISKWEPVKLEIIAVSLRAIEAEFNYTTYFHPEFEVRRSSKFTSIEK